MQGKLEQQPASVAAAEREKGAQNKAAQRLRGLPLVARRARDLAPGWYAVALERRIAQRPCQVLLGELPYVLYREPGGSIVALLDRCPHRNVPLSGGRLEDGVLECPYHGWKFAPSGECLAIPGRKETPKAGHAATSVPVCVHEGLVFLRLGKCGDSGPLTFAPHSSATYTHLVRQVSFPGGLFAVVENALDVPHTSILHRGLFRGGKRNVVQVVVRRFRRHIEAQYIGEPPPTGLLARLLGSGGRAQGRGELVVEHWDRFWLPSVLQVEYRLGAGAHILITGYATPISDERTELFALVALRTPLPRFLERLLVRVVEPFARIVLRQDMRVLAAQAQNIKRFAEARPVSTELDVLYAGMTRLLKEAEERTPHDPLGPERSGGQTSPQELAQAEPVEEITELTMET